MGQVLTVRGAAITATLGEDECLIFCNPNNNNYIMLDELWISFRGVPARDLNSRAYLTFEEFSANPTGGSSATPVRFEEGDNTVGNSQWFTRPSAGFTTGGTRIGSTYPGRSFNFAEGGFYWNANSAGKPILINETWVGWGVLWTAPEQSPSNITIQAGVRYREIHA
jgi:hypothetical protein